jgi:hypothetical protein
MKKRRKSKSYESSLNVETELEDNLDSDTDFSSDSVKGVNTNLSNKSDKSVILIIGVVIIFLALIFILFKTPTGSNNDRVVHESMYGEYPLIQDGNDWFVKVFIPKRNNSYNIEMRNSPFEVENITFHNISYVLNKIVNSDQIYLSVDPELGSLAVVGMIELSRITGQRYDIYNIPTTGALTRSTNFSDPTTPIMNCANSTASDLVIEFEIAQENMIYPKDNCIIVSGTDEENIVKSTDRLVYTLLGVIKQ